MLLSPQLRQSHSPLCHISSSAVSRMSGWTVPTRHFTQRACHWQARTAGLRRQPYLTAAAAKSSTATGPASAKDAVEQGLQAFHERRDAATALSLFEQALKLSPSEEEARAAMYNSACAHAKLKQWKQAADAAVQAINKYGESLSTAVKVKPCSALLKLSRKACREHHTGAPKPVVDRSCVLCLRRWPDCRKQEHEQASPARPGRTAPSETNFAHEGPRP